MHPQETIARADSPAMRYAPAGEDLGAVIVSMGVVAEYHWDEQMRRRRVRGDKRIAGLVGLQAIVVAGAGRNVDVEPSGDLRAGSGFKVVRPFCLSPRR